MGAHSKPVDDDVERALASMRAGFLAGSEQIAAHIATLDRYLLDAPSQEGEAVRAQIARLVAVHDRITARVVAAPASAWDSFKVLVSAVKQQQDVLDQVSFLVERHLGPRQYERTPLAPFPAAPPPAVEESPPPSPPPHDDLVQPRPLFPLEGAVGPDGALQGEPFRASTVFVGATPHSGSGGHPDIGFSPGLDVHAQAQGAFSTPGVSIHAEPNFPSAPSGLSVEPLTAPPRHPAQRHQSRGQASRHSRPERGARTRRMVQQRMQDEDDEADSPSLLELLRERTAGFRGLAAMLAVGIILSMLPRERLQEVGAKLFDFIAPAGPGIAAEDGPPRASVPMAPRVVERVAPASDADLSSGSEPKLEDKASAPSSKLAVLMEEDPPGSSPSSGERFVPVVFTHKDHATVMRAWADLKQQYPKVLSDLEGEVQPVPMGKKGTWHRLVFLPAGPRSHASKVCDQLAAEGYDRCYVRAY